MSTETLHLAGTGWGHWTRVRELLAGCDCLWVDLFGAHHERAPDELPIGATHLWGWDDSRWLRVRIDAGHATAAVLGTDATEGSESVTARRQPGLPWSAYGRTAPWHHPVTLLIVDTPVPITFVAGVTSSRS